MLTIRIITLFTLITFLCSDIVYSLPSFNLRLPLRSNRLAKEMDRESDDTMGVGTAESIMVRFEQIGSSEKRDKEEHNKYVEAIKLLIVERAQVVPSFEVPEIGPPLYEYAVEESPEAWIGRLYGTSISVGLLVVGDKEQVDELFENPTILAKKIKEKKKDETGLANRLIQMLQIQKVETPDRNTLIVRDIDGQETIHVKAKMSRYNPPSHNIYCVDVWRKELFDRAVIELLDPSIYLRHPTQKDFRVLDAAVDLAKTCDVSDARYNLRELIVSENILDLDDVETYPLFYVPPGEKRTSLRSLILDAYAQLQQDENPQFWINIIKSEPKYAGVAFTGLRRCDLTSAENFLPTFRDLIRKNPGYAKISLSEIEEALTSQRNYEAALEKKIPSKRRDNYI